MLPSAAKTPSRPTAHLQQPLEELEEATKAAMNKGKRNVKKAQKKIINVSKQVTHVSKQVLRTAAVADAADDKTPAAKNSVVEVGKSEDMQKNQSDPTDTDMAAPESTIATAPLPAISKELKERSMMERQKDRKQLLAETDLHTPKPNVSGSKGPSTETMLTIFTAIFLAYHAWACKAAILANEFPLSVVFLFVVVAFLLGYNMGNFFSQEGEQPPNQSGGGSGVKSRFFSQRRRGIYGTNTDTFTQTSIANSEGNKDESNNEDSHVSRTRKLARSGRHHLKRFGRRYIQTKGISHAVSDMNKQLFWSNLSPHDDVKEWEKRLKAPVTEGPLMDHLLKYSDFHRHKIVKKMPVEVGSAIQGAKVEADDEICEVTDISIGHAKLNNTRAESLESDEHFSHKVDPMCELRGMDLFLTDDPLEEIWRQPLLNQCGLRDTPTFIANLMMPFGNITAYFKLPDWVEDWENIPEEKHDDPPDVKALKRFLMGDDEYRNARTKCIPYIVDGPLAIRLIKPKPMEVNIDGPRHPTTWQQVSKSVSSSTGKANAAILECDIDLLTERTIRKIINIVRPHIQSITCDLALIISTPKGSEIEEPSACLGLWRIEKVDFEGAAVFPELAIEDAVEEVRSIVSGMEGVKVAN